MLRAGEWLRELRTRERALERGARGGAQPSSEAEPRPRGRSALERGGIPPEGVFSPRARRSLGDVAVCPSSEAGFRPRGAGADRFDGSPRLLRVVGPYHRVVVVLGVIYNS
jgi:hypothetical protein